eukprot:6787067-Prymnesium_polylepis.1
MRLHRAPPPHPSAIARPAIVCEVPGRRVQTRSPVLPRADPFAGVAACRPVRRCRSTGLERVVRPCGET